jgi:hypothetical protein
MLVIESQDLCVDFCISILLFSFYSHYLNSTTAQSISWKKYSDPGKKFNFLYPTSWSMKSTHDNVTDTTEVVLESPNSSKTKVSVLYNLNEELPGKPVIPSRALTHMTANSIPSFWQASFHFVLAAFLNSLKFKLFYPIPIIIFPPFDILRHQADPCDNYLKPLTT